jgi:hypothetical protein
MIAEHFAMYLQHRLDPRAEVGVVAGDVEAGQFDHVLERRASLLEMQFQLPRTSSGSCPRRSRPAAPECRTR